MKMAFDIYAKSQENRGKYNLAVTNSAACLTNELYIRTLQDENIKRCIYIAGPYGAGKSFFTQSLYLANAIPKDTIVYEGSITAPAFEKKVERAMRNNIKPELVILNPTLELSLKNIKQREIETGWDVIKSEYSISFQIYNKTKNVEESLDNTSYDIRDLKHGTREEVSRAYDLAMKQLAEKSLEDGMENYQLGHSCLVKKLTELCKCDKIQKEVF